MNRFYIFSLLALIGCSACTSSASNREAAESVPDIPVVEVSTRDTVMNTAYVANIKAVQNTEIRSRVHGFLEKSW